MSVPTIVPCLFKLTVLRSALAQLRDDDQAGRRRLCPACSVTWAA